MFVCVGGGGGAPVESCPGAVKKKIIRNREEISNDNIGACLTALSNF